MNTGNGSICPKEKKMDEKTALRILGLDKKPTREEARKAFHCLAKIHHPDHFARNPGRAGKEEDRMKQINLAFHFLLPRLKPQTGALGPKKTTRPSGTAKKGFWSPLITGIFHLLDKKWGKKKKTGPKRAVPKRPIHPVRGKQTPGPDFGQVLCRARAGFGSGKRTVSGRPEPRGKKAFRSSSSSHTGFMNYMAVRHRAGQGTRDPGDPFIVEKICPIQRIGPVRRRAR